MTEPDAALREALAGLRRDYVAGAPRRLAELRAALQVASAGDREALERLRDLLHRLAGSGGGYGLQEVSTAARAGELAARALLDSGRSFSAHDLATVQEQLDRLAAAFDQARSRE